MRCIKLKLILSSASVLVVSVSANPVKADDQFGSIVD